MQQQAKAEKAINYIKRFSNIGPSLDTISLFFFLFFKIASNCKIYFLFYSA